MAFKFERLEVWQKAVDLTSRVHDLTKTFPKGEQFVLASQIQRATDSIALNIAEGSTGQTNAEFRLFLGYAIRSAMEVIACLFVGKRRGIIQDKEFNDLYADTECVARMTQALRRRL